MKLNHASLLLVSLFFSLTLLNRVRAEDVPPAPANHLYDPDFLLTRETTENLGAALDNVEAKDGIVIYLAIFTETPRLIDETAQDLNDAWNQSGYGVVIAFAPRRREVRVLPSPQLSLLARPDALSEVFRRAAEHGLVTGDYSTAAREGTAALLRKLHELREDGTATAKSWRPSRPWQLAALCGCVLLGLAFLWFVIRIWRRSNLFDHSYRFPVARTPAPFRLGAKRCGGLMATLDPPKPLKPEDV
jgi:uncharacterized membrane protein YgcG